MVYKHPMICSVSTWTTWHGDAASQAWPWDCMCQYSWSKVWLFWLLSELLLIIQVSVGFFPIFEGWGLMQLAEKWESTTEVLCHHQLDLSRIRVVRLHLHMAKASWAIFEVLGIPNLDPLAYHTGMGFASQSTPLAAWHRHHISKASMFKLYSTAMFDPLFLGTFIPQMSKKTTTRFSAPYIAHFPLL